MESVNSVMLFFLLAGSAVLSLLLFRSVVLRLAPKQKILNMVRRQQHHSPKIKRNDLDGTEILGYGFSGLLVMFIFIVL